MFNRKLFGNYYTFIFRYTQQSKSIYCQGVVDSVKIVTSCPESKAEWDYAARRKDCSIIASKQNCSSGLQFEYHCVINEYRSKLLEVCAPRRFIFGKGLTFISNCTNRNFVHSIDVQFFNLVII